MAQQPIDDDDASWLAEYEADTFSHFRPRFEANLSRFDQGELLLARFSAAIKTARVLGRAQFHAVDETHNELCVADAILSDPSTTNSRLLYEPRLANTDETIDFLVQEPEGAITLVDVKTIRPQIIDRWDQYERAIAEGWLPRHVQFLVNRKWMGGAIWHAAFTSRARFLQYSLELEHKIAQSGHDRVGCRRILMFCGEGFHWHQDQLEDFVAYYRSGVHRTDDPFALAEAKYITERRLKVQRTISSFGCLSRRQGETGAHRVNWLVQPPAMPLTLGDAANRDKRR